MPELDLGNVKGPQGKSAYQSALDAGYSGSEEAFNTAMAKAPDAVLYTAQSLTDEQKEQARGNINAAPGGYGFGGEPIKTVSATSKDETYESFCARLDEVMSEMPNNSVKLLHVYPPQIYGKTSSTCSIVFQHTDGYCGVYNIGMPDPTCSQWRMIKVAGVWQPFEWINPPMELGTEYRTTERYLGKPLYKKLIEFPSLTGRDYQQVHGRDGFVISAIGEVRSPQDTNFWMPMVVNPVAGQADAPFPTIAFANFYSADVGVVCASTSEYIGQPARVLVTYYKTTD